MLSHGNSTHKAGFLWLFDANELDECMKNTSGNREMGKREDQGHLAKEILREVTNGET